MGLFSSPDSNPAISARLARVERKIDLILGHLGLESPDDGLEEVRALAAEGKKIDAIKLYRELTGEGLMEAKQFVDGL